MKRFLVVTCVLLLCLCLLPAGVADAPAQELTILFTHDLHSHVDTIAAKDGSEIGGFAKLKTVIDSVRAQDDAVLVVDAGDFAMGTLYQSVYAEEALELRLLGAMGFDATTYGNHEFDYGSNKLAEMLLSAKASGEPLPQLLVSNINWDGSTGEHTATLKAAMEAYGAKPYTVIERGGVRIALFGLLGKDADECAPTSGLDFADIIESAKQTVATIKQNEQADMIVCLSHSGTDKDPSLSEDELLAAAVPEIDFIVSGHTHTTLANGIRVGDTMIGSVGEYGENVGKAVLQKRADGRWDVTQYALIPIDESIVSDASMLETVAQYRTRICAYLEQFGYTSPDQVIAYSPYTFAADAELSGVQAEQPLGNLISDSYIYAIQKAEGDDYIPVDVAVVPVGVIRASFDKGPVTVADAYEVSSLGIGEDGLSGYPLCSVWLTGAELKTLAEVDASVSVLMPAAQLYCSGLQYSFNPNRLILNRVTDVQLSTANGLQELENDRLYRVVAGMYSAQMLGTVNSKSFGLLKLDPKDAQGNSITDFSKTVIIGQDGREVKEWYALASYLQSFPAVDGVPTVPADYAAPQGRKQISDSTNLWELLKAPNHIAWIVYGVVTVLLALIALTVWLIVRSVKKKRQKKAAENIA